MISWNCKRNFCQIPWALSELDLMDRIFLGVAVLSICLSFNDSTSNLILASKEAAAVYKQTLEMTAEINQIDVHVEAPWEKSQHESNNLPLDTKAKGVGVDLYSCSVADAGTCGVTVKNPTGSVMSSAKLNILAFLVLLFLIYCISTVPCLFFLNSSPSKPCLLGRAVPLLQQTLK